MSEVSHKSRPPDTTFFQLSVFTAQYFSEPSPLYFIHPCKLCTLVGCNKAAEEFIDITSLIDCVKYSRPLCLQRVAADNAATHRLPPDFQIKFHPQYQALSQYWSEARSGAS